MIHMKNYLKKFFDEKLINEVLTSNRYKRLIGSNKTKKGQKQKVNIEVAKTLYENYNLPIYKIAMLYGVSDASLRQYLLNANCILKGHRCGKNSHNDYFNKIDTIDKAYFLGLIFADGNIREDSRGGGRKIFSIMLTEEDRYILETFNQYANFNTKLIKCHKNDIKPRFGLFINSSSIYDDLCKLGVSPRKSKDGIKLVPNISEELIPHFIRGYFDGDGIAKKQGYIGFCGDYRILKYIKDNLIIFCNVKNNKIIYNKSNNIYYIQWASKKDVSNIFNFLYKDKNDIFLKRKHEKIRTRLFI